MIFKNFPLTNLLMEEGYCVLFLTSGYTMRKTT